MTFKPICIATVCALSLVLDACAGNEERKKVSCNEVFPLEAFNLYGRPLLEREVNTVAVKDLFWFMQNKSLSQGAASSIPVTNASFVLDAGEWKWVSGLEPQKEFRENRFQFPVTTITLRRLSGDTGWQAEVVEDKPRWALRQYSRSEDAPYYHAETASTFFQSWRRESVSTLDRGRYTSRNTIQKFGALRVLNESWLEGDNNSTIDYSWNLRGTIGLGGKNYVYRERVEEQERVYVIDRGDLYCEEKDQNGKLSCGIVRMGRFFGFWESGAVEGFPPECFRK